MKRFLHLCYRLMVYVLALVGLGFVGVFIALKFHWTDVPGGIDARSQAFAAVAASSTTNSATMVTPTLEMTTPTTGQTVTELNDQIAAAIQYQSQLEVVKQAKQQLLCQIIALSTYAGVDAVNVWTVYQATQSTVLLDKMTFSLSPHLSSDYTATVNQCQTPDATLTETVVADFITTHAQGESLYNWQTAEEWPNLAAAVDKDADLINRVAAETDVPARLIAAALLVEQLRLFHTQREYYEQYFAPLKILASATKFAWGVMSIKEATAQQIESHLMDTDSVYYLGDSYAHALDFSTSDSTTERYNRLTNDDDHYYAYLYGALYIKQLMAQWQVSGYDISQRPEIILTLFNIGFANSQPKVDPAVGGSTIEINDQQYTFGGLGYEIYYSGVLLDQFNLPSE